MDDSNNSRGTTDQNTDSTGRGSYSWLDQYQSGNYDSLPHDEIYSNYRDWARSANPDDLYEATYRGYESLPADQLSGAAEHLYNYSRSRGLDLSDVELSSPDYQQWTAHDVSRVTGRAYGYHEEDTQPVASDQHEEGSNEESKSGGGVPKPLIGLALAGALAFAASKVLGGNSDKKEQEQTDTTSYATMDTTTSDYTLDLTPDTTQTSTYDYADTSLTGSTDMQSGSYATSDTLTNSDDYAVGGTSGLSSGLSSTGGADSSMLDDDDTMGSRGRGGTYGSGSTGNSDR